MLPLQLSMFFDLYFYKFRQNHKIHRQSTQLHFIFFC
nr:MAG TPA: hypothetical protein [Caudoviricetes sp.]